jgi:hypothetical protein
MRIPKEAFRYKPRGRRDISSPRKRHKAETGTGKFPCPEARMIKTAYPPTKRRRGKCVG